MNAATFFAFSAMSSVRSAGLAQQAAAIRAINEPHRGPRKPLVLGGIDEAGALLVEANRKLKGNAYK